ncbi:HepT-like ribonuclease domain-containing protein [Paraburkholderia mimosarum]|uniref:HepT-like ribonuclease domain-containing protein n=1 Tax=Paraburkholderia mimosarum TaxID=312026 RepID=UPI00041DA96C|nr:DUF86 domain-containing protein [Paraburkholderia mimosarum]
MRKKDLRTPDYLQHILDAIERIGTYTAPLSRDSFAATPMAVDAVVRNITIIGEATRNITRGDPDFAAAHPEIPWEAMYGMRNHVTHGYFVVDIDIVWSTVQSYLPGLEHKLSRLTRS